MIVRLWGFIPVWVRYVPRVDTRILADGTERDVIGRAHWFYILIREDERENVGLLAHELEHCKQAWKLPFLHTLLKGLSKSYRAWTEASAYAAQLMAYGWSDQYREARINAYAYLLANAYGLGIAQDRARDLILQEIAG